MKRLSLAVTRLGAADWLTGERAGLWLRALAAVTALFVITWLIRSRGGVDPTGRPLSTDFISFWTASRLALQGTPAAAYDQDLHMALQQATFPAVDVGYTPFPYPPMFLFICLPLGLLPYLASLFAWIVVTLFGYWRVVDAWLVGVRPKMLLALAFPAVLLNLAHGQNAFLTTALFGGGALLLRRSPFLAGACLGALIYKPQLGILIPVALLGARQWRAIAGAATTAVCLTVGATLAFGTEPWAGFFQMLPLMRYAVETNLLHPAKLQSTFSALRLWDAPLEAAYGAQIVLSLCVAGVVGWFATRAPTSRAIGPVLITATLLATPYIVDYDLTLTAIPMAWVLSEGLRGGFLRWEKLTLLAAYALPLVARVVAARLGVPLGPPILMGLLLVTLRRGLLIEMIHREGMEATTSGRIAGSLNWTHSVRHGPEAQGSP